MSQATLQVIVRRNSCLEYPDVCDINYLDSMTLKPDCGTLPWLAAALTIVGAAGRLFIPSAPICPNYLFFGVVACSALALALLGWRCHIERQLPAPHIQRIIVHLSKKQGFSGTVEQFNQEVKQVLYEQKFSQHIRETTDYYSVLIAHDFIKIVGASRIGSSDSGLYIALTDRAQKLVRSMAHAL